MGNWNIRINGIGVHNNTDVPEDADKMAKQFVKDLKEKGHTIESATFTDGCPQDISKED